MNDHAGVCPHLRKFALVLRFLARFLMDPAGSFAHSQNRVNWMETRRGHDAILGIVTRLVTRAAAKFSC